MNILEGAPSGSMKLEWHLDGALLRSIPSYTGVAYGTNAQIILGVAKGTATTGVNTPLQKNGETNNN